MFKTINKLKNSKRGFTLPEVLVTLTVLLIALTLTTQLIMMIIRGYRATEYRWIAQTMAEYIASSFSSDSGLEAMGTANVADLMYENPTADDSGKFTLACCPELGNITYNSTNHTLTIVPSDSYKNTLLRGYIYYFSYDEHLYRIHYADLVDLDTLTLKSATIKPISEELNLIDTKEMDAEVTIDLLIARSAGEFDTTVRAEDFDTATKYLASSLTTNIAVKIVNKADRDFGANADMNVSLYLNNMNTGEKINYLSGGAVLSNSYVAGWTKNSAGNTLAGFPNSTVITNAGATTESISHAANIIRYHSVNTPSNLSDSTQSGNIGVGIDLPICFFTSLTAGSGRQVQILEPLRDFRDTVLKGSAVGEWVIDKYYDWSPAFIGMTENNPVIRGVFKLAAEGLAAAATIAVE